MRCWAVEGQTPGALASPLTPAQGGELMFPAAYYLYGRPQRLSSSVHHVRRPLCWHSHSEVKVRLPNEAHHDLANLGPQRSSPTVNVSALRKRLHASHITKCERR
jgi:hypothetical protein